MKIFKNKGTAFLQNISNNSEKEGEKKIANVTGWH